MRSIRLAFLLLAATAMLSTAACTNPTGPTTAQEDVLSSKI